MIEELPPGSHYLAALADDDDLAEQVLDARQKESPNPSLAGWDNTQSKLAEIVDLLQSLCAISAHSDSPPEPIPRPITAADRLEQRRKENKRAGVLSKLLGDRFDS